MQDPQPFLTIARVAKTQGRKGEVACDLFTDFPEKFAERKRVLLWNPKSPAAARREATLEEHWFHKGRVVLKFAGIDSISDAETLIGCEVQIPESERAPLEQGAYYISDLAGCTLLDGDRPIGTIRDVNTATGGVPLLVVNSERGELEIPFAEGYLVAVDLSAKQVRMRLPEGLLDINA